MNELMEDQISAFGGKAGISSTNLGVRIDPKRTLGSAVLTTSSLPV